jgi:superfamily II DNA or RNA helicase
VERARPALFGCLIGDEIHHVAAPTWEQIVNLSPSRYRLGFTATVSRADGMQPLMTMLMGPVLQKQKIELKMPTKVIPVKSGFYFGYRGAFDWGELQRRLIGDEKRNAKIAEVAARQMQKGHSVLILSRRIEHLENIKEEMWLPFQGDEGWLQMVQILTGKTPGRKKIVQDFRDGKIKCLLSTQLADEALDVPILSRVILTYPGKHDGRIIQQVGRALREFPDKDDAIIFDIVDDRIGVLRRQWMERKVAYKKMGIPIQRWKNGDDVTPLNQAQNRRLVNNRIRQRMRRR